MPARRDGESGGLTLSRRSVLGWLGKGATLALGADLLLACGDGSGDEGGGLWDLGRELDSGRQPDLGSERDGGHDAGTSEDLGGPEDAGAADEGSPGDAGTELDQDAQPGDAGGAGLDGGAPQEAFPFEPGPRDDPIYDRWNVRTVDQQDALAIVRSWRLEIGGLVEQPLTLTFADLLRVPRQDQITDFHCVEGWSVYDVPWNGVHLSELLERVRPLPSATHVAFPTIGDGYNGSLPLEVALEPRTLLAYGVGERTLPLDHGFPLRVVVPRLFGYKSIKYVQRVELTDHPVESFWVQVGYGYEGEVPEERLRDWKW